MSGVQIFDVSEANIDIVKWFHQENFLEIYCEQVYEELCARQFRWGFLGEFDDTAVGEITTEVQEDDGYPVLYISTLSVAEAYRGSGIGERLLSFVMEACTFVVGFALHVRASNAPALGLYQKLGFEIVDAVPGFYRDGDAYYMRAVNHGYSGSWEE
jgi:ribosomal protein S18 acetylase RimI-like enzyme